MELKKELAEKVMHWEMNEKEQYWRTQERQIIGFLKWNPEQDINDAWVLTYEFDEFLIRKRKVGLEYRSWGILKGKEYISHGTDPSQAILNLVRRAYNLKK